MSHSLDLVRIDARSTVSGTGSGVSPTTADAAMLSHLFPNQQFSFCYEELVPHFSALFAMCLWPPARD